MENTKILKLFILLLLIIIISLLLKIYWNFDFLKISSSTTTEQSIQEPTISEPKEDLNSVSQKTTILDLPDTGLQLILPDTYTLTKDTSSSTSHTSIASYSNKSSEVYESGKYMILAVYVTDETFLKRKVMEIKPSYGGDGFIDPSWDLNNYYKLKKYFTNEVPLEKGITQKILNNHTWFITDERGAELPSMKYQTMFNDKLLTIYVSKSMSQGEKIFDPEKADKVVPEVEVKN